MILVSICIFILISSTLNFFPQMLGEHSHTDDKKIPEPKGGLDIRIYNIGDTWTLISHSRTDNYTDGTWQEVNGNGTVVVSAIEDVALNGTTFNVYNITTSGYGNMTGTTDTIGFLPGNLGIRPFDMTDGEIDGYRYHNVSDGSLIFEYTHFIGTLTVHLLLCNPTGPCERWEHTRVFDPVEDFDFLLREGGAFRTNAVFHSWGRKKHDISDWCYSDSNDTTFSDDTALNATVQRPNYVNHTVDYLYDVQPPKSFDCYAVNRTDRWNSSSYKLRYYNDTWKIAVEEVSDRDTSDAHDGSERTVSTTQIKIFTPGTLNVKVTEKITPSKAKVDDVITVDGYVNDAQTGDPIVGTDMTIEVPWTAFSGTAVTDENGYYTCDLVVPDMRDNTPTTYDHGSVGIKAYRTLYPNDFNVSTLTIFTPDATPPEPPTNVDASLVGDDLSDIQITWYRSNDEWTEGGTSSYNIFRAAIYNGTYELIDNVFANDSSYYSWIDLGMGDGNLSDCFYYIESKDDANNTQRSEEEAGKFVRNLQAGRQLISIPLVQSDTTLTIVLQTIDGNYNYVQWYDPLDAEDHWMAYSTSKPSGFNDLFNIDHKIGIWIEMILEDNLTVAGKVPNNTIIQLYKGWNFVGYPSFNEKNVSETLKDVPYDQVEGFDENAPYYLRILKDDDVMSAGCGYWIRVTSDCKWTL